MPSHSQTAFERLLDGSNTKQLRVARAEPKKSVAKLKESCGVKGFERGLRAYGCNNALYEGRFCGGL